MTREPHNAISLYARGEHWVECSCSWLSRRFWHQAPALVEHAHHITQAKATNQETTR